MFNLTTAELTINSIEVAEMVRKEHNMLLRDIRKYCEYLGQSNFAQSDFFIESSYVNSQNKQMPCYLVTRKGCHMVGNKLTGQKGTLFTAAYINRFHEMEQGKQLPKPKPQYATLQQDTNAQERIGDIKNRITAMSVVLDMISGCVPHNDHANYALTLERLSIDLHCQCFDFKRRISNGAGVAV